MLVRLGVHKYHKHQPTQATDFIEWHLIFVGLSFGNCMILLFWHLDFWKICGHLSKVTTALIADVEVLGSLAILQLYYYTKLNVLAAHVVLLIIPTAMDDCFSNSMGDTQM